jgi:hypothetical protein
MTNGAGSGGLRRFAHGLGAALCLALSVMLGTHSGVPFRLVAEPFCGGFAIATLLAIATAQVAALANTATLCGTVWPERAGTIPMSRAAPAPLDRFCGISRETRSSAPTRSAAYHASHCQF